MLVILIRTLLIYFFLVATLRLMGKRQIGELEVPDLVTTLLLSEIASIPITDHDIPLSYVIIPMVALLFLEILSSVILVRLPKLKSLVSARPTVLIRHGVLDQRALLSLRISVEELMGEIRQQGYSSLSKINDAILEKNGKLTVLPKAEFSPPTLGDLQIRAQTDSLMHVVFSSGSINEAGLRLIGKDAQWLLREIARRGYSTDRLFCATANEKGELLLVPVQDRHGRARA